MSTTPTTITIRKADGTELLTTPIPSGSTLKRELMKEDYITLKLSLATPVQFSLGCYCDTQWGRYTVVELTAPTANASTGGYDYELRLDADYYKWRNKIFKYRPKTGGQEASWSLTAQIGVFMEAFVANLEALGYGNTADGVAYKAEVDGTVTTEAKALTFSNANLIDALSSIADEFGCDWWVEGNVIHMGTCETGEAVTVESGVDTAGLDVSDSSGTYATRLYIFGGTTNVPARYRKKLVFDTLRLTPVTAGGITVYDVEDTARPLSLDMFGNVETYSWAAPAATGEASGAVTYGHTGETVSVKMEASLCSTAEFSVEPGQYSLDMGKATLNVVATPRQADLTPSTLRFAATVTVKSGGSTVATAGKSSKAKAFTQGFDTTTHAIGLPTVEWYAKTAAKLTVEVAVAIADDDYDASQYAATPCPYASVGLVATMGGTVAVMRSRAKTTATFATGTLNGQAVEAYLYANGGCLELVGATASPSLGDKFTLDIITAKVPVGYFQADTDEETTVTAITEQRLMLPLDWNGGHNWLDAKDGMEQAEIVETVATVDDIYPRLTSTVGSVQTYRKETTDDDGNGTGKYDTFYLIADPSLKFKSEYRLSDSTDITILFYSGGLAGMRFTANFHEAGGTITKVVLDDGTVGALKVAADSFELIANEDYGRQLPDTVLCPATGDTFSLGGYDASYFGDLGLVEKAEAELLAKGKEYMEQMRRDGQTYTATLFWWRAKELQLSIGQKVLLRDASLFDSDGMATRVIGCELKLDIPDDNPEYTFGQSSAYSRIGELESQLDSLAFRGATYVTGTGNGNGRGVDILTTGDSTAPTEANVNSAKRADGRYLRKDTDDTAAGDITFEGMTTTKGKATFTGGVEANEATVKGDATIGGDAQIGGEAAVRGDAQFDGKAAFGGDVTFGQYIGGMVGGMGGRITPTGAAELQSLTIREYLEVPELRYNRISIQVGNRWRAPGGGIIESVTPDRDGDGNELASGTLTLHLEDGEVGTIAEGDICQGIWHEDMTAGDSGSDDYDAMGRFDDSRGNFAFKGFYTAYFRIDSIADTKTNAKARYVLRPTSDTWAHQRHPHAMMHFVCYGNFTNADRQSSRYSTLTYERYLRGVDNWEFTADMIAAQEGDLSNLAVHGLQMAGYSAYLNNIYMSGTIKQFEQLPVRLQVDDTLGGFVAWGEVDTVTCTVTKGFDDVTDKVTAWRITRDSGDSADDVVWNNSAKAKAFGGTIDLGFGPEENDIGNNAAVHSTIFTVTATIGEETATAEITI